MRAAQQALVAIADQGVEKPAKIEAPSIDAFLAGLRTAWKEGEIRPTARPKPKQKRGRRRPDPLVAVTGQLRSWFEADPSRTGRELLERLQGEYPDCYPAGLLRTLQRRLKVWRGEMAQALVFGGAGRCDLDRTAVTGAAQPRPAPPPSRLPFGPRLQLNESFLT
ncbi:MAG: integrase [Microvirga sp.]|nr:integrase [Microvirga sp.]